MDKRLKFCQTCLSTERLLYPLTKLNQLLKEINLEVKGAGGVCWECKRVIDKIYRFKTQVCQAQELLYRYEEGQELPTLSILNFGPKHCYDSLHFKVNLAEPIVIKQEPIEIIDDYSTDYTDLRQDVDQTLDVTECDDNSIKSTGTNAGQIWSDLPKITLVESISECELDAEDLVQLDTPALPGAQNKTRVKETEKTATGLSNHNVVQKTRTEVQNEEVALNISIIKEEVLDLDELETGRKTAPASNIEGMPSDEATILRCKQELDERNALNQEHWKKSVLLVYSSLRGHKYASRFLHPITDDIAPEYSKVIKRPMELNTIRRNIKTGAIRTTAEFQRDILLMITNALMYNSSDHCIYDMAKELFEEAQYQLGLLLAVHTQTETPVTTPVTRTKRRLEEAKYPAKKLKLSDMTPKLGTNPCAIMKLKLEKNLLQENRSVSRKVNKRSRKSNKVSKVKINPEPSCSNITPKLEKQLAIVIPKLEMEDFSTIQQKHGNRQKNFQESSFAVPSISRSITSLNTKLEIMDSSTLKKKRGRPRKSEQEGFAVKLENIRPHINHTHNTRHSQKLLKNPISVKKEATEIIKVKKELKRAAENRQKDPNYRQTDDLCVAITTQDSKELIREQACLIKKDLEEKIRMLALDSKYVAPRFRGEPVIAEGVIKLWCEDKKSLKWLIDTVKQLPLKLGTLAVVKQGDLPKKLQSALTVPGSENEEVIKKLLRAQNPWAQIDSWAFYSAEQRGENMFIVTGIPSTVIPVLLARERRLAYNLGSVVVKFYSGGGKLCDTPPELSWF